MEDVDINFDHTVDQLTRHLWVLRETKHRDGVAAYEKVLRDEWEAIRRDASKSQSDQDGIGELSEKVLTDFIQTIEEIKSFIGRAVAEL